jgi:hypothetical protein
MSVTYTVTDRVVKCFIVFLAGQGYLNCKKKCLYLQEKK